MTALNMTAQREITTEIVPLLIRRVNVLGEPHWIIHEALNSIKIMYPARFFTSISAVEAFCFSESINPNKVIIRYEED